MTLRLHTAIRTPRHRVLSGSAVLLTGLGFVTLINFAYNIAVARFLGPVGFGHTTAVYTLLILISAVTLSFQILTAKIVAQQDTSEAQAVAYRGFHVRGWLAGIFVGLLLVLFRDAVTGYLNLPSPVLIVLLAIGAAFYVPLGSRRGYIQGTCAFRHLALNLVLEGVVRLGGSLLMMLLGYGVPGVIAANAAAVVLAYFLAKPALAPESETVIDVPVNFREGLQAAVFFAGQVVINNCDIVAVKHFFPSDQAGIYSAIAMVGRVVFAFAWAVVSSMFPIAAESRRRSEPQEGVLGTALLMVFGILVFFAVGLWAAPGWIWVHLFGPQFGTVGGSNFSSLLVLYAVSAGIYALSVVMIAYEMSRKIANTGWFQLLVSGTVIGGIYVFHSSLVQVIWVQIAMMIFLLLCVAVPYVISLFSKEGSDDRLSVSGIVRLRRPVSEDEVIAEFLKNDFRCPEFDPYHDTLVHQVMSPNLDDRAENELRRALLFIRHGALWRELPKGTEWFEAEIRQSDLPLIRVFPRAHWRKMALGDYTVTRVAKRIADESVRSESVPDFIAKIGRIKGSMGEPDGVPGAVLLIGVDEKGPFTILDGNHRLVAALLSSPNNLANLRFFCGLSSQMTQCCWYDTNLSTLLRYARNMLRHVVHDPEEELTRLLQRT